MSSLITLDLPFWRKRAIPKFKMRSRLNRRDIIKRPNLALPLEI